MTDFGASADVRCVCPASDLYDVKFGANDNEKERRIRVKQALWEKCRPYLDFIGYPEYYVRHGYIDDDGMEYSYDEDGHFDLMGQLPINGDLLKFNSFGAYLKNQGIVAVIAVNVSTCEDGSGHFEWLRVPRKRVESMGKWRWFKGGWCEADEVTDIDKLNVLLDLGGTIEAGRFNGKGTVVQIDEPDEYLWGITPEKLDVLPAFLENKPVSDANLEMPVPDNII